MSEEAQAVEETQVETETVDNRDELIADLNKQLKETNQKLVDSNEEAMRRRKTNERLKSELEALQKKPVEQADNSNEEIIAQIKNQYEEKLKAEQSIRQDLVKRNAMNELKSELASQNIISNGLEPLSLLAKERIGFDENGNIRIMSTDKSKPLAGSGGDGYATIADLAKELAASETGQLFVKDGGVSGGGKPPASSGGKSGVKSVTRSQFNSMGQRERSLFFKDGGKVVNG